MGFDAELFARYEPSLLQGLKITLELVALSVPLGFALAIPVAYLRLEGGPVPRSLAAGFAGLFRGTPLLAQIFLFYYGTGQFNVPLRAIGVWPLFRDAFWCATLVFTLNTAAYQSEILRGAVASIPAGQTEAGRALGLGRFAVYRLILGPQALILALRPLGNELILMIKASSLASVVTLLDLFGATKKAFGTSLSFELYLWAAVVYLALVEIVRRLWNLMERRMTRHLRTA